MTKLRRRTSTIKTGSRDPALQDSDYLKRLAPCGTIGGQKNRQTNHLQNFVTPRPPSQGHLDRRQSTEVLSHFSRTEVPPSCYTPFRTAQPFLPSSSLDDLCTVSVSTSIAHTRPVSQASLYTVPTASLRFSPSHFRQLPFSLRNVGRFDYYVCLDVSSVQTQQ